jgi:acyl-[acyl-carrier-protein] desaturase
VIDRLEEELHGDFAAFFERAERERRWSVAEDVPWETAAPAPPSPELVLRVETFFLAKALAPALLARDAALAATSPTIAAHLAGWAYEASKHALAFGEWLIRRCARSRGDLLALARRAGARPAAPVASGAAGVAYGSLLLETATFVLHARHREHAARAGDAALVVLHDFAARDELAHARFHEAVMRRHLAADREAVLAEMARVLGRFEMPDASAVPDWDARVTSFAAVGFDRGAFVRRVYLPTLRRIRVERRELVRALPARSRASTAPPRLGDRPS